MKSELNGFIFLYNYEKNQNLYNIIMKKFSKKQYSISQNLINTLAFLLKVYL